MPAEEPIGLLVSRRAVVYTPAFRRSRVLLLAAAFGTGLLLYLAVEPTRAWVLLLLALLVTLGADGVMREHPAAPRDAHIGWTAPYLLLPALLTVGTGLFLEDALHGYLVVPGALVASLVMGALLHAEYTSIDSASPDYPAARFALHVGIYLTAFFVYASVYSVDVSLVPAALCVGLASVLLCLVLLHESEADPVRGMVFAGIIGLVVAEARWGLYFLPLESYLAAVFLLLVFYLASGLVQHHLGDDLGPAVLAEFGGIAALGVVIVTLGRIFES